MIPIQMHSKTDITITKYNMSSRLLLPLNKYYPWLITGIQSAFHQHRARLTSNAASLNPIAGLCSSTIIHVPLHISVCLWLIDWLINTEQNKTHVCFSLDSLSYRCVYGVHDDTRYARRWGCKHTVTVTQYQGDSHLTPASNTLRCV